MMIAKAAWELISGHRSFLVLVAMAIVAGGLWVRGERAIADRDRVVASADQICAAAGSAWIPAGAGIGQRGQACRTAVADLAGFKAEAIASSNQLLAAAQAERTAKADRDAAARTAHATSSAAAARRMEDANAKIAPDDRVDRDWFDALNQRAGLRPRSR